MRHSNKCLQICKRAKERLDLEFDGETDGVVVGACVGSAVGDELGMRDGDLVGFKVLSVGLFDGS